MTTTDHSRPAPGADLSPDDADRRRGLRRMKAVATGLLLLAAAVFVAAALVEEPDPWVGYVEAAAEAAMVGALADWFAVTALFRHPLGIPIPHTAIVKKRKDQIGASLGGFVRDNFLTADVLRERLAGAELGRRVGGWLAEPENAAAVGRQGAAVTRGITEILEDDVVQSGLEEVVTNRIAAVPVTPIAGRAVDAAIDGDHHQVLLEATLVGLARFIDENQTTLRQRLYQESPWWVPEPVDDRVFDRITEAVGRFLSDVGSDRTHPLRLQLDERTKVLADELKTSDELRLRGEALKAELVDHPEFRHWIESLWSRTKAAILEAADDPESPLRTQVERALADAGRSIESDPALAARIDGWIVAGTSYVADQFRGEVAELIASTVQRWDTDETSDRIELQVGRDLQFIRINGTIVGGLAGLVIHGVSELLL